jgi:hypothetical protein
MPKNTNSHPSNSDEQRQAEQVALASAARALGLTWSDASVVQKAWSGLQVDGFCSKPLVVCEVFSHIGSMKSGQQRKVASDMLKLLLCEKLLRRKARKLLVFVDDSAADIVQRGWHGEAFKRFGFECHVARLSGRMAGAIKSAQERQYR